MRRFFNTAAIAGAVFAAAAALALAPAPASAGDQVAQATQIDPNALAVDESYPNARLVLGNQWLIDRLEIDAPRFRKRGAFTQVAITVRNTTQDKLVLEHKTDWYEDGWFPVDQRASWHRFSLSPNATETITSMGKRPEASSIEFTVRFPDDVTVSQ